MDKFVTDVLAGEGEKKEPHPWPSRSTVSPLENALSHFINWRAINKLRGSYDFPEQILSKDEEKLKDEIDASLEETRGTIALIREWNEDPEKFVNPFEEQQRPKMQKIQPKPEAWTRPQVETRTDWRSKPSR